jgi:GT2 family glycosyltransferase
MICYFRDRQRPNLQHSTFNLLPRFSIIIVTWNALHHLQKFLPSVVQTTYDDFEIIIADNASTDGSVSWAKQTYPHLKIISFDHNYGYCGGNNRAVPYATGDILLFLNNDVKVEPNWLLPLAKLFHKNPDVAVVQPKLRSYRNSQSFEYAGAAGGFIDRYGYPFCRGRIFDTIEMDEGQYDDQQLIFWASGAAFAIRKKIFQEAGGFDEDFEFHMEEIDLCWRLWNRGYRTVFCYQSIVYHLGGGSLPMNSPRKTYYNYRNSLIMLWKNYPLKLLIFRFPVRVCLDGIAALRALLKGSLSEWKAIIQAYSHFFSSFAATNEKRRKLRKTMVIQAPLKPLSIVWQYFIKKIRYFKDLPN